MKKNQDSRSYVRLLLVGTGLAFVAAGALAGDLTRGVRLKISAGDLLSAEAMVDDYRRSTGADAEYLDGRAWLARGALLLGDHDRALEHVAFVRGAVKEASSENLVALGAALEVEARILVARKGKEAALKFLEKEKTWSDDLAFRSRLLKNVNLLTLEGQAAPAIETNEQVGAKFAGLEALRGKAVVLFLWAHWCGDCKAQAASLALVKKKFGDRVVIVAPTRFYGTGKEGKEVAPAEEKVHIAATWNEVYAELGEVSVPISTEAMIRYGASATPSFVFIDRQGIVRSYTPTRLTEAELERRIESLLMP
jgi:thiol-disulfide isomerase/thioredoxin